VEDLRRNVEQYARPPIRPLSSGRRAFPNALSPSLRSVLRSRLVESAPSLRPEAREHPGNGVESVGAAMNLHDFGTLLQSQCGEEARNAEHVIQMAVRQQEPIEPSKAGATPQLLALSTLPAIHENSVAARFNEEAWMIAFCRWNACQRTEKCQVEHRDQILRSRRSPTVYDSDVYIRVVTFLTYGTPTESWLRRLPSERVLRERSARRQVGFPLCLKLGCQMASIRAGDLDLLCDEQGPRSHTLPVSDSTDRRQPEAPRSEACGIENGATVTNP
jgi:hypothetical protein